MDRARRRRSARLPVGGARATCRTGPGWAGRKTPQMGPGTSGGPTPVEFDNFMKGNRPDLDPLRTSGFWRLRVVVFGRIHRVVEIYILL